MAQKYTPPPLKTVKQPVRPVDTTPAQFVFGRANYRIFLIAIAVVAFGFVLMSGTTDIYDFRKIVLAPLVVLTGFAIGFFAIFKKPDTKV